MKRHQTFTIGELSKITGVSKETLRHWAEWGIISRKQNTENGYFIYYPVSLSDIHLNIMLRNFGLSIKQIKEFYRYDNLQDLTKMYRHLKKMTVKKINVLKRNYRYICETEENMRKALSYDGSTSIVNPPFSKIYENISVYSGFPTELLNIIPSKDPSIVLEGTSSITDIVAKPLWELNSKAVYFYFLIERPGSLDVVPIIKSKLHQTISGYDFKLYIIRYLTSIPYENTINYFEVWVEAYKKSDK